jgi:hypothetical protein
MNVKPKKLSKTGKRGVGDRAALMRYFIDSLRLVLRKEPLYGIGDSKLTDEERFYVSPHNLPYNPHQPGISIGIVGVRRES